MQSLKRFLFKVADDGDLFTFAREDQCRGPGEIVCSNKQVQSGVTYAAGFTDECEPHVGLLLFEDINRLIYFFLNESHASSFCVRGSLTRNTRIAIITMDRIVDNAKVETNPRVSAIQPPMSGAMIVAGAVSVCVRPM